MENETKINLVSSSISENDEDGKGNNDETKINDVANANNDDVEEDGKGKNDEKHPEVSEQPEVSGVAISGGSGTAKDISDSESSENTTKGITF